MIVDHIIEDVEKVINDDSNAEAYHVAFACYSDDGTGNIEVQGVEAFHWDDDEEFFLVPDGGATHYDLTPRKLSAGELLRELKADENKSIRNYGAYARYKIKILDDGSVASFNSPLWGTGVHNETKLVYFYHGKEPAQSS